MALEGPDKEVLGGEEQKKETFDEKVHRIVTKGVIVPAHLKERFLEEYDSREMGSVRDLIREAVYGVVDPVSFYGPGADIDAERISAFLRGWSQEEIKAERYAGYRRLMEELGHEPVLPSKFHEFKGAKRKIHNQVKMGLDESICIRFQHIQKTGMKVGALVSENYSSTGTVRSYRSRYIGRAKRTHNRVYTLAQITPDCKIVLAGNSYPSDPRNYRVQS